MNIFLLILPFIALSGEPGAAFVKNGYATMEDCKAAAEEKVQQAKRQVRQVKAVCVPMEMQLDAEEGGNNSFRPNNGAAVGDNT